MDGLNRLWTRVKTRYDKSSNTRDFGTYLNDE